jgi:hypothetical protein
MAKKQTASPANEVEDAKIVEETVEEITVTLEQASRFYELMVEFKLDQMIDAVSAQRSTAPSSGAQVVTAAAQKEMAVGEKSLSDEERVEALTIGIDMGHIVREIAKKGGYMRLGAIILGCTEEEAKQRSTQELQTQLIPFLKASAGPLQTLLGFVGALA